MNAERPPAAPPRLTVRILGAVLSLAFAVVIAGALAEIFSRTVVDDGMHFDLEMWKYAKDIKKEADIAALGHEHRPGTSGQYMGVPVVINALGLRDKEYAVAKPPGTVRVLMLGDSLTFGWGVRIEDTPSKMVERKLNEGAAAPRFEVINAGVGNYNTVQEVTYFLNKGQNLNPDVVVLNYFINDAEPTPLSAIRLTSIRQSETDEASALHCQLRAMAQACESPADFQIFRPAFSQ